MPNSLNKNSFFNKVESIFKDLFSTESPKNSQKIERAYKERETFNETKLDSMRRQIAKMKKNEIYKGIIDKIDDHYLLVKIGEVRGILYENNLFCGYSNRPLDKIFKKGQAIDVKVNEPITFDEKGNPKIVLSHKEWLNKWDNINNDYQVNCTYNAVIVSIEESRMWVRMDNGLEASIVRQEYTWPQIYQDGDTYHVSDNIKVMVLNIDKEKRRIYASIKRCEPNPWKIAAGSLEIGGLIEFKIVEKSPKEYIIYICDHQNLLGILPFSEVSWYSNSEALFKDKKYKGKLLEFNSYKYILKVSIKSLMPDPWETIVIGGIVNGIIRSNDGDRSIVSMENGLQGYTNDQNLSINTPLDFKVISFDCDSKEIKLSHNRIKFDIEMDSLVKKFFNHRTK